ncbi:MAG: hypothetical protein KDD82_17295 [Planctomycetes bacterium]|nr:hypothetical protein [Planctomycetota bacterium]
MKRWTVWGTLGSVLLCALALRARAQDDLAGQVLAQLARADVEQARELLEHGGPLPGQARPLLRFACDVLASPEATPALSAQARALAARVEPSDLALLRDVQASVGPRGAYFEVLIDAAYAAVERAEPPQLLELSASADPQTRGLAVAAIASWLAPLRARVTQGGWLEPDEQDAVRDADLIEALIARLGERASALDRVPPELAVRVPRSATAYHALLLIEEPALPGLREADAVPGARATIAAIQSAVDLRQRRFPGSTWADARPRR